MDIEERELLHDIIIDLRKALNEDNDEVRAEVSRQIDRLYELYRKSVVNKVTFSDLTEARMTILNPRR